MSNLKKVNVLVRRFDWAASLFLFQLIALIILLLSSRRHARIGVGAVRKQNQRAKTEEEALQEQLLPLKCQTHDLTTHLHPRSQSLTPHIGVRRRVVHAARSGIRRGS